MIRALAITISNRAAAGTYPDKSGPVLAGLLREADCEVDGPVVIPDGSVVEQALRDGVAAGYDVRRTGRDGGAVRGAGTRRRPGSGRRPSTAAGVMTARSGRRCAAASE